MICLLFKTLGDSEHRFCPFDSVLPRMERSGGAKSAGIEDLWKILDQKEDVRENTATPRRLKIETLARRGGTAYVALSNGERR